MDKIRGEGARASGKQVTFGGIAMIQRTAVMIDPVIVRQTAPKPTSSRSSSTETPSTSTAQAARPIS
ncbi:hypothetical protein MF271_20765 (plasmid) [Deinococcus sp. KNUC1210]|uniref:hypothetical protein n=1 Tax=Deinococcus sp. KNUC1210 TaxID=2917691 RepID=UPI001EF0A7A5|nr:hypothetical protein [Deinococcus sp. KNUC1210]ULH17492.1 hypothetical protein MF271_20765 [Deinococcus sp. KNUC1210]